MKEEPKLEQDEEAKRKFEEEKLENAKKLQNLINKNKQKVEEAEALPAPTTNHVK